MIVGRHENIDQRCRDHGFIQEYSIPGHDYSACV
jgi:tRNA G37 N-methylase TrmD